MNAFSHSASNLCRRVLRPCLFLSLLWFFQSPRTARAQSEQPPAPPAQTAGSVSQPKADSASAEIISKDEVPTFKVDVKLVLVRVVVRDPKGRVIGNLHKDDFQLFDNRKPQVITQFSAEQPGAQVAKAQEAHAGNPGEVSADNGKLPALPERYIAYVFDDVHLKFGDLMQVRNAADRHIGTLQPTDRAAIFSTSGQTVLDFTDDRAKLHDALLHLQPRSVAGTTISSCPDVTYYMADLIVNKDDSTALQVATEDALVCAFNGDTRLLQQAHQLAFSTANQVLAADDAESRLSLTVLRDVIRRMSVLPGQRSIVLVSPGFLTPQLEYDYSDTIDHAVRSQVTIGALDARGLYVITPGGDISKQPRTLDPMTAGLFEQYALQEASEDSDILGILADATGGTFFHNSNDLDEGFKRVASTPEYFYVLGFSPQNLKLDGSFHSLKVTLKNPEKLSVQARRGYFAPKHAADPAEEAKQEIEDALFSQDEVHDLPVQLHTQFFKSSDVDAKLTVVAHIDVRRLHFRKVDGRNRDDLIVVSALFNRNGSLVQGSEKTVTMRLKDETLESKLGSGITLKASFDVKPGSYLVRLVVRDTEAQLLSAENDAVQIP
jgi:VWFA-related protein